ncbi:hypothetical protein, partial [Desulfolutivibrio sulfodismutans]|uniref:hypothetical protein n=1 Tax=Desulfolutivibrio sulfodismutans TaxID=63561 RepID=UPI001BA560B6
HRSGGGWRNGAAALATGGLADPFWRPCGMRSGRGPVGGMARALAGLRRLQGVIRMIVRRRPAPFR